MEPGTFWLFACPWDWTWVGRYVKHLSFQELIIDDALYFTRTGATFDLLCKDGLTGQSQIHPCGNGIIIPAQGPKIPWRAATPWAKGKK
jgi:hypothetical protein